MVYSQLVEGLPQEIGNKIAQIVGDRRVSVLLLQDIQTADALSPRPSDAEFERMLEEIRANAVSVPHVDDSREAIYTQQADE